MCYWKGLVPGFSWAAHNGRAERGERFTTLRQIRHAAQNVQFNDVLEPFDQLYDPSHHTTTATPILGHKITFWAWFRFKMSAVWNRIKYTSNECAWEWRILDTSLPISFIELFRSRTTIHVKAGLAVPVRGSARQCEACLAEHVCAVWLVWPTNILHRRQLH